MKINAFFNKAAFLVLLFSSVLFCSFGYKSMSEGREDGREKGQITQKEFRKERKVEHRVERLRERYTQTENDKAKDRIQNKIDRTKQTKSNAVGIIAIICGALGIAAAGAAIAVMIVDVVAGGFWAALIAGFLLALTALILGIVGMFKSENKGKAKLGLIFGGIAFGLLIVALALLAVLVDLNMFYHSLWGILWGFMLV